MMDHDLIQTLTGILIGAMIGIITTLIITRYYYVKGIGDKKKQKKTQETIFKDATTKELARLGKLFAIFHISRNDTAFMLYGADSSGSPPTFVILGDKEVKIVTCGKPAPNSKMGQIHNLINAGNVKCKYTETVIPDEIKINEVDTESKHKMSKNSQSPQ